MFKLWTNYLLHLCKAVHVLDPVLGSGAATRCSDSPTQASVLITVPCLPASSASPFFLSSQAGVCVFVLLRVCLLLHLLCWSCCKAKLKMNHILWYMTQLWEFIGRIKLMKRWAGGERWGGGHPRKAVLTFTLMSAVSLCNMMLTVLLLSSLHVV